MNELPEYGPRMLALTEKQRGYVRAMASAPFARSSEWARRAGYSDSSKGAKVAAFRLRHDPKIEAAVLEYAGQLLHQNGAILAVSTMMEIARNKGHPKRLAAAEAIADRIGLHRLSEHKIVVEHQSTEAMVARIKELAAKLGMDAEKLLGANMKDVSPAAKPEPKVIEHRPAAKGEG